MERLSSQFHCIAVDLPGFGKTAATAGGFRDLTALAASLDDVRVEHNIDKWHIVGHDAGCAIAVHCAHRFKNRVGRLALLSPSMFPDLKPFCLFEVLRRPVIGELMAPLINLLFWNVAMRLAMAGNQERYQMARDFQTPFLGLRGSWRLCLCCAGATLRNCSLPYRLFCLGYWLRRSSFMDRRTRRCPRLSRDEPRN